MPHYPFCLYAMSLLTSLRLYQFLQVIVDRGAGLKGSYVHDKLAGAKQQRQGDAYTRRHKDTKDIGRSTAMRRSRPVVGMRRSCSHAQAEPRIGCKLSCVLLRRLILTPLEIYFVYVGTDAGVDDQSCTTGSSPFETKKTKFETHEGISKFELNITYGRID